jgi:hypothetical protein
MTKTRRTCNPIFGTASVLCLLVAFNCQGFAQTAAPALSTSPCKDGASPGVLEIIPDGNKPDTKLKLARKRFYLSTSPFNLSKNVNLKDEALSLRKYYGSVGASLQLIQWLEDNHCETIYCRELTAEEVKCEGIDSKKCVPEFIEAFRNALGKLKGNQELARRSVTNYLPLSSSKLRTGFYEAKTAWLKGAVEAIEKAQGGDFKIRSTITDRDGIAYFYDLCPGNYYVSSIAPVDIEGAEIFWETAKQIKVQGPPNKNKVTIRLALPPGKDGNNFYVGYLVAEPVGDQKTPAP